MSNTGDKRYIRRVEVFTDSIGNPIPGEPTGTSEPNTELLPDGITPDPNYVADVTNIITCPIGEYQLQTIEVASIGDLTGDAACDNVSSKVSMWYNGANTYLIAGDTIYEDFARTTPFNGGSKYYNTSKGTPRIGVTGVVILMFPCP